MALAAVPITLAEANEFVRREHRHHPAALGHKFSVGVVADEELVGVAICGRPVARGCDQHVILEVTRLATNGHKNACSFLLARCAAAARALGYQRIQTYTLQDESGASLRAAGWSAVALTHGRAWGDFNRNARRKELVVDKVPRGKKVRWELELPANSSEWPRGDRLSRAESSQLTLW